MTAPVRIDPFFLAAAVLALASAGGLALMPHGPLPILGQVPLLPVVVVAGLVGWPALAALTQAGWVAASARPTARGILVLSGIAALLALPPIVIDLTLRFPRDLNLAAPAGLVFYPAAAFVAEVVFHLVPLAILSRIAPRTPRILAFGLVALIEPLVQMLATGGATPAGVLVLCSVTLFNAAQLGLLQQRGFAACFGLRLIYYAIWHGLWGTLRLT